MPNIPLPNGTVVSIGTQTASPTTCPCLNNFSDAKTLVQVVENNEVLLKDDVKTLINDKSLIKDGTTGNPLAFHKICSQDVEYAFGLGYEQVGDGWYWHLIIVRYQYNPTATTIIFDERQQCNYDGNGKLLPPGWSNIPVNAPGCETSLDVNITW